MGKNRRMQENRCICRFFYIVVDMKTFQIKGITVQENSHELCLFEQKKICYYESRKTFLYTFRKMQNTEKSLTLLMKV